MDLLGQKKFLCSEAKYKTFPLTTAMPSSVLSLLFCWNIMGERAIITW